MSKLNGCGITALLNAIDDGDGETEKRIEAACELILSTGYYINDTSLQREQTQAEKDALEWANKVINIFEE
jgi:hypothetical protein